MTVIITSRLLSRTSTSIPWSRIFAGGSVPYDGPGETEKTANETIRFAEELRGLGME
jgi:hypothetical protein